MRSTIKLRSKFYILRNVVSEKIIFSLI